MCKRKVSQGVKQIICQRFLSGYKDYSKKINWCQPWFFALAYFSLASRHIFVQNITQFLFYRNKTLPGFFFDQLTPLPVSHSISWQGADLAETPWLVSWRILPLTITMRYFSLILIHQGGFQWPQTMDPDLALLFDYLT